MDQYHGQGGTYLLDPETGERVLLERTEPPAPENVPPPEPAPSLEHARRRARAERGRFRGDDPATPDVNEAWQ
jgi:hypothetical protein